MKLFNLFFVGFIFISTNTFAQNWDKYAVPLGEKNWNDTIESKENNCQAITIRLDGEGNYYPNIYIKDRAMKRADGKLSKFYHTNPTIYQTILNQYHLPNDTVALTDLNQAIETRFVHLIDSVSKEKEIVFLIHGYRKQMYDQKDNALSTSDNDTVEAEFGSDKLFVEVYWDSKHITKIKGVFGKKGLKMMEASAIPNAKNVGIQLRSLVSSINQPKIGIVCHSLGSIVGNSLTFNFDPQQKWMDGKELRVVYLGPAIGHDAFKTASQRGTGNYQLATCIGFNANDFVLLKHFSKFGVTVDVSATSYGNTSLGCNFEGEIDKLLNMYASNLPKELKPVIVDMSGTANHHFTYYAQHDSFSMVIEFLFGYGSFHEKH